MEKDLAISLKQYNSMEHHKGELLPESQQHKSVKHALTSQCARRKTGYIQRITGRSHRRYLFDLIPFVLNK